MSEADTQFEKERNLFLQALEIDDEDLRRKFLIEECAKDSDLRVAVEQLLNNHAVEFSPLDNPLFGHEHETIAVGTLRANQLIDGYRLESLIGEGGMGEVWVANQKKPVVRRVALKLIKHGMHTPQILRRFDAERQALASMDHPNIASILDGGSTSDGQPYFVMELINGAPLIQFCDQSNLSIAERLKIFVQIANAVQHAHQRAIIHRDLKPSNLLVTMIDGHAVPKIIDFGLAKALSGNFASDSLQTQFGTVIGTLSYMAPEQASFSGQDVDTRTDVYSLGVILYELLTGMKPIDFERFDDADLESKFRMIRDDEPTRPSARISTIEATPGLAYCRRSDPTRLARVLRGELDWIVLKALEKDRSRRYQSAGELADDVQRFINNEPVDAHPPSKLYRAKKFIVKNRLLVAAVASVVIGLTAGLIGSSYGLYKARIAEAFAAQQQLAAEDARDDAKDEAAEANRQKNYAEAIANFLQIDLLPLTTVDGQLFEGLSPEELGHDATLGQLLDRAAEQLPQRNDIDLEAKADLLRILGISYRLNSNYTQAIRLLRLAVEIRQRHFADDAEALLRCSNSLSVALSDDMRLSESIKIAEDAIDLATEKLPAYNETLVNAQRQLAEQYVINKKPDAAKGIIDDVLVTVLEFYGKGSLEHLITLVSAGLINQEAGRSELAITQLEFAIEKLDKIYGSSYPDTIKAMMNYGNALLSANRIDEAAETFLRIVKIETEKYGQADVGSMGPMNNIGVAYWKKRELDKSIPIFESLVEIAENHFGRSHPRTLFQIANLAINYRDNKESDRARELFDEIVDMDDCPDFVLEAYRKLLVDVTDSKRFAEVADIELDQLHRTLEDNPARLAVSMVRIGHEAESLELNEKAVEIFSKVLDIQESVQADHWHTSATRQLLGATLVKLQQYEQAKQLLEKAYKELSDKRDEISSPRRRLQGTLENLIKIGTATGDQESVAKWQQQMKELPK